MSQANHTMKNIKITPEQTFQIQFIRKGKSYSDYATDYFEAIEKRDALKAKLGKTDHLKQTTQSTKESKAPNGKIMPVGMCITQAPVKNKNFTAFYISVSWVKKIGGKPCVKGFYIGTDNTFDQNFKNVYKRALKFRQDYETAVKENTLEAFDPTQYNVANYNDTLFIKRRRRTAR